MIEQTQEPQEKPITENIKQKPIERPIKIYNETLYSEDSAQKNPKPKSEEKKRPLTRTRWENADTIEKNIDTMGKKQTGIFRIKQRTENETSQKVDHILSKKKRKS